MQIKHLKNKKFFLSAVFLIYFICMLTPVAAGMSEAAYLDLFNQLTGGHYTAGHIITQDEYNNAIAAVFGGGEGILLFEEYIDSISEDTVNAGQLAAYIIKTLDYKQRNSVEISTIYGTGSDKHEDGDITTAKFSRPAGIAINKNGDVYILDTYNNAIRTLSVTSVGTLTGKSEYTDEYGFPKGYYLDGALDAALLNNPADGVFNAAGELFFTDNGSNTLRFVRNNRIYTFSGTSAAGHTDGAANKSRFSNPTAIAIDKDDNIYVADSLNHCIRKIDKKGRTTTIAGIAGRYGYADGTAKNALFRAPAGIAVNGDGSIIYVADTGNHIIRIIENGNVSTLAGHTTYEDYDGDPVGGFMEDTAMFNLPKGLVLVNDVLLVADSGNHMIRAVTKTGNVTVVAGTGDPGDTDGPALEAMFNFPGGLGYYNGTLYIADTDNNKIKVMPFDPALYTLGE